MKPESFDFSLDHEFLFNPEEKLLVVELRIALKGTKATEEETEDVGLSANYDYQFFFKIENIMDFVNEKKVVDPSIVSTVLSIGYSTLRGIILERTSGTLLGSLILPIISPAKLLTEKIHGRDNQASQSKKK